MRLLNTTSLEVERFTGSVPPYAILSHRWEDDEVTLEDISATGNGKGLRGYQKLRLSCAMAARQDLKYIWIDTCCIDKKSSAELSEAINSMFRYYKEAEVCYTYLSDVTSTKFISSISGSNIGSEGSDFYQSDWFTRGWTLQELIASQNLQFYNREWEFLGTKADLKDAVRSITKIPEKILLGGDLSNVPVSKRMSWVASRQTTVPEDIAYCLLGIFQVNIPLLYGEGTENAFLRLQEAILKTSDDESIFLWCAKEGEAVREPFWGLLAKSPSYFSHSPDISTPCTTHIAIDTPATLTGRGLSVEFLMVPVLIDDSDSIFCALFLADGGKLAYGVLLQKLSYSGKNFARVGADIILEIIESRVNFCPKLPRRFSWILDPRPLDTENTSITIYKIFSTNLQEAESQAMRFYVRQKPKIPQAMSNEAVGFLFNDSKNLPLELKLEDLSKTWDSLTMTYFELDVEDYVLEFEMSDLFKMPVYRSGTTWGYELFGALQFSRQKDDVKKRLILLLGLEHTSKNFLDTPLVYYRPMYFLFEIPLSSADPDFFLKKYSPTDREFLNTSNCYFYDVSFDRQLRNTKVYYIIEFKERSTKGILRLRN